MPKAPSVRLPHTPRPQADSQVLEQSSLIVTSPTMTSILRKKNSNVGILEQASKTSETDKDNSMTVSGLQTFRDYKSPMREKSNSTSQISLNPMKNSATLSTEKRSVSKRKSYF